MRQSLDRRQFLITASAAALSAPFALSCVGAAAGRKGPNDRITLGFIGTGTQGRGLLNGFLKRPDTQVVAVCDVDTNRREFSQKAVTDYYGSLGKTDFHGCAAFKDFRDLLARKDLDAVVIATPDHWHAVIAIAAS